MSFINGRFIEDRATRDALGQADVIRLARAMLNDKDPAVRKAAAAHLAKSGTDEVRKMVGAPAINKSPAGAAGVMHGQRVDRGTKVASITGGSGAGGGGKVARPAINQAPGGSRFAHLANGRIFGEIQEAARRLTGATGDHAREPDNKFARLAPCYGSPDALRALTAYTQAPRPKAEIRAEQAEARELGARAVTLARRAGVIR